jgi:DNA-binding NtrC family response regulator
MLLAARSDFTIVISDLRMPDFSGVELHDHIAAVAPDLLDRVIFSTGDVASREAADFVQRTKCTVLQKPFELRALDALVSRIREMTPA